MEEERGMKGGGEGGRERRRGEGEVEMSTECIVL